MFSSAATVIIRNASSTAVVVRGASFATVTASFIPSAAAAAAVATTTASFIAATATAAAATTSVGLNREDESTHRPQLSFDSKPERAPNASWDKARVFRDLVVLAVRTSRSPSRVKSRAIRFVSSMSRL